MSNNKTRLLWVDQLKAVGMFFVIWGHCVQRCANKVILQGIYSFHMPFFFILSGLTMNPNKYEKVTEFIQAKLKAIIYPYLMMSFALIPIWLFNRSVGAVQNDSLLRIICGIFYSNAKEVRATANAAWFMVTLFLAELIFYIIHKYMKEEKLTLLTSFAFCIFGILASHGDQYHLAPFHLDVAFVAQFFVCSGYYIRAHLEEMMSWIAIPGKFLGPLCLLVVGLFFGYINRIVDISNMKYQNPLYMMISSYCITLFMIYIARKAPNVKILNYIGKNTMIYLMVHIPMLRALQYFFPIIEHSRLYGSITAVALYVGIIVLCPIINQCLPWLIKWPFKKKQVKA